MALSQYEGTVFVITYGRSGSTLIQNLINALPGHLLRGENAMLLAPLVQAWHGLSCSEQRLKMVGNSQRSGRASGPHQPWFGYEAVLPDDLGQALARSFMETVLRPSAGIHVVGFKEIRWHQEPALFLPMLDFLQRYFPRARFIFNTRDHDETARSGWWKNMDPALVKAEFSAAEALYAQGLQAHPEASIHLHYNDYVKDLDAWRPLFTLLEQPFDPNLLRRILDQKLEHLKPGQGQHPKG